jgi:polysulfide reductase chain C
MESSTMEHTVYHWNLLIAFYLFAAGVSAGAFFASGLATYIGGEQHKRISRIGALIAPWPVIVGLAALIFDLTKPFQFWWLFLTVEYTSPMSIGAWLLTLFTLVALVYFVLWFPRPWRDLVRVPQRRQDWRQPKTWKALNQAQVDRARRAVAAIGAPIAIGVGM